MKQPKDHATLEQWLAQLQQGKPEAVTAQQVAHGLNRSPGDGLQRLLSELEDAGEDAQATAWYEATIADEIVAVPTYLNLDLATLPSPANWIEQVTTALSRGSQRVYDELGALCFAFTPQLPQTATPGWATRSQEEGQLIFRFELARDAQNAWEVEVTGFREDDHHCRLEVGVIQPDALDADLTDIPITLLAGNTTATNLTDRGGVAEFVHIPIAGPEQMLVRVGVAD